MFQTPEDKQHIPPHWMGYISVEDIEKTLKKVTSLGGNMIMPKTAAGDMGCFAIIQDPTGAHCVNSFNKSPLNNKNAHIVIKHPKKYSLVYDKQKIKQVIDHLLSNAVKWTEPNQVIDVEISKSFLPNSSISGLYCKIKNKGVQIPPNELNFIFEPFTESSNTASKAGGVGLGLALCKEIIKAHKGKIWAENDSTIGF